VRRTTVSAPIPAAILHAVRSIFTPPFRRAFVGNFFSDLAVSMLVNFPGFLTDLGAGEAVIGAIASVAAAAAIAARPWAGQTMDRFGRIPLVRIAAAFRIACTLSFLLVHRIGPALFAIRALYVVAAAIFFTGMFTYASDVMIPERRAQGIAYYGLSGMTAATFGAALGGVLVDRFGYSGLFLGVAIAEAGALAVAFRLKALDERPPLAPPRGVLKMLGLPRLRPIWALTFGFGLGYGALVNFMRTYVDTTGYGSVGLYFSVYSLTAIVTRLTLSTVPDRWGPEKTAYPAISVMLLGIGMLAFAHRTWSFALAAGISGLGHAFLFPVLGRMTVERAPADRRAAGLSLYTSMFDLGPLVGAPILGIIIERVGYRPMFLTLAATMATAMAAFGLLDRAGARVDAGLRT
jgi:MFS family permease